MPFKMPYCSAYKHQRRTIGTGGVDRYKYVNQDPSYVDVITEFMKISKDYDGPTQEFVGLNYTATATYSKRICAIYKWEQPATFCPNTAIWKTTYFYETMPWKSVICTGNPEQAALDHYANSISDFLMDCFIVSAHRRNEERVMEYFDEHGVPKNVSSLVTPNRWESYHIYHHLITMKRIHHFADPFFVLTKAE